MVVIQFSDCDAPVHTDDVFKYQMTGYNRVGYDEWIAITFTDPNLNVRFFSLRGESDRAAFEQLRAALQRAREDL